MFVFSGDLIALILQRENAIRKWREMLGPTSPYRYVLHSGILKAYCSVHLIQFKKAVPCFYLFSICSQQNNNKLLAYFKYYLTILLHFLCGFPHLSEIIFLLLDMSGHGSMSQILLEHCMEYQIQEMWVMAQVL